MLITSIARSSGRIIVGNYRTKYRVTRSRLPDYLSPIGVGLLANRNPVDVSTSFELGSATSRNSGSSVSRCRRTVGNRWTIFEEPCSLFRSPRTRANFATFTETNRFGRLVEKVFPSEN